MTEPLIDRSADQKLIHIAKLRAELHELGYSIDNSKPGPHRVWRRLVIECDGRQFHERTKEQAAKDRSRDRWLVANDYDVFRFTGSELWRDPWSCAEQVLEWGVKGW